MRDGSSTGGRIEGSLYFMGNPTLAEGLRTNLTNSDLFSLTYTDMQNQGTDQTPARAPGSVVPTLPSPTGNATPYPSYLQNSSQYVYGKGYRFTFAPPSSAMTSNAYANDVLLMSVTETNLDNSADESNISPWSCPLHFMIVQAADAAAVGCDVGPDPAYQGPTDPLWIARNSLRVEDWYIDMTHMCIVHKNPDNGNGCYGPQPFVQYDLNSTFWEYFPTQDTAVNPLPVAFASICVRAN
jgi:hypothetical protein